MGKDRATMSIELAQYALVHVGELLNGVENRNRRGHRFAEQRQEATVGRRIDARYVGPPDVERDLVRFPVS